MRNWASAIGASKTDLLHDMHERRDNPIDEAALSADAALRAAADGELSAARAAGLGADPENAARIAFERSLREAVGRTMGGGGAAAPADLRAKIEAALRAERASEPVVVVGRTEPRREGAVAGFIGALRANAKIAALLALALTLGVVMVWRLNMPTASERLAMDLMAGAIQAEGERHVTFGQSFERYVPFKGEEAARTGMEQVLGAPVPVRDLSTLGYEVAGLAPCSLAWSGRSGQLLYRAKEGEGWLTLIMHNASREEEAKPLPENVVSVLRRDSEPGSSPVFIWREGDVVFYLVSPDEASGERALPALGAPRSMRAFDPEGAWSKRYSGGMD